MGSFKCRDLGSFGCRLTAPAARLVGLVTASALALLTVLGAVAARVGGAPTGRGALRVAFWGALAMAASAGVGRLFGTQLP